MTIISNDIDAFVATQNSNRGNPIGPGGLYGTVGLDYNALSGTTPTGGNSVTGVAGIPAGASGVSFNSGFNVVIFDGANSAQASASGSPDSYALIAGTNGITVLDNNTQHTLSLTGVDYLIFNGGVAGSNGSYQMEIVTGGDFAKVALMYDAAFMRQPDLPGLEFNAIPELAGKISLHQTAVDFLASAEFKALYPSLNAPADNGGPNDQAFITQLYGQILHRTPTTAEVNFYVQDLQGTLPNQTTPADRAQLLVYFSVSPENQANSAWLINTDNGTYTQPGYGVVGSESSSAVFSAGLQSGVINTALIDPNQVAYGGNSLTGVAFGPQGISTTQAVTVELSSTVQAAYGLGPGTVIDSAAAGSSGITLSAGATANLTGTANHVTIGVQDFDPTAPVTINGFNTSDFLRIGGEPNGIISTVQTMATVILAPTAAAPLNGATLDFTNNFYVINVGNVGGGSTAEVAAAANKVYMPGDIANEQVVFIGETTSGNLVLDFWHSHAVNGVGGAADTNGNHLVDVAEFDEYDNPAIFVGVTASVITTHTFF